MLRGCRDGDVDVRCLADRGTLKVQAIRISDEPMSEWAALIVSQRLSAAEVSVRDRREGRTDGTIPSVCIESRMPWSAGGGADGLISRGGELNSELY